MRPFLVLVVSLMLVPLALAPLAAAEGWQLRAGGATMSPHKGVVGVMFSATTGASLRYWSNATSEGSMPVVVVTVCYGPSSQTLAHCERQWLHP